MPSSLEVIIEQMINSLDSSEELTFATILEVLHRKKFDGAITIHCHAGIPKILETGRTVRFDLSRRKT